MDPIELQSLIPTLVDLGVTYGLRVLGALALLIGVWIGSGWLARILASSLSRTELDANLVSFLTAGIRWTARLVGLILSLGVFGVQTTSVAALIGGAGVAIGIALKGNLSNLAGGVILLAVKPFRRGDWIEADGREGLVARVGLLHTELDTFGGSRHWIPNASLVENGLLNHHHHPWRRAEVAVGVAYDADLTQALEELRAAADAVASPDAPKAPLVIATGFGPSSIDFKVGAWVPTEDLVQGRTDLILAVKSQLDQAGIAIPFPQRDLHLHSGSADALAAK